MLILLLASKPLAIGEQQQAEGAQQEPCCCCAAAARLQACCRNRKRPPARTAEKQRRREDAATSPRFLASASPATYDSSPARSSLRMSRNPFPGVMYPFLIMKSMMTRLQFGLYSCVVRTTCESAPDHSWRVGREAHSSPTSQKQQQQQHQSRPRPGLATKRGERASATLDKGHRKNSSTSPSLFEGTNSGGTRRSKHMSTSRLSPCGGEKAAAAASRGATSHGAQRKARPYRISRHPPRLRDLALVRDGAGGHRTGGELLGDVGLPCKKERKQRARALLRHSPGEDARMCMLGG